MGTELINIPSVEQCRTLEEFEQVIQRGLDKLVEVGKALKAIRDKGLYRTSHDSFKEYVQERWQLGKARAYQYIGAAETADRLASHNCDLSNRVAEIQTEGQLRELRHVPSEDLRAVIHKADEIAGDKRITGKVIKEARDAVQGRGSKPTTRSAAAKPVNDDTAERARRILRENIKSIRLQFSHLGLGGRADKELASLERKAKL